MYIHIYIYTYTHTYIYIYIYIDDHLLCLGIGALAALKPSTGPLCLRRQQAAGSGGSEGEQLIPAIVACDPRTGWCWMVNFMENHMEHCGQSYSTGWFGGTPSLGRLHFGNAEKELFVRTWETVYIGLQHAASIWHGYLSKKHGMKLTKACEFGHQQQQVAGKGSGCFDLGTSKTSGFS